MNKPVFKFEGILIEQDPMNWIVKVPHEKTSKNQRYNYTYFSSLEGAVNYLYETLIKRRLDKKMCHSIKELKEEILSIKKELLNELDFSPLNSK